MTYEFIPRGVCSRRMIFEIENNVVESLEVIGGCSANLLGIASLVQGMTVDEIIDRLEGIRCGTKPSSCPGQIAQALREFRKNNP